MPNALGRYHPPPHPPHPTLIRVCPVLQTDCIAYSLCSFLKVCSDSPRYCFPLPSCHVSCPSSLFLSIILKTVTSRDYSISALVRHPFLRFSLQFHCYAMAHRKWADIKEEVHTLWAVSPPCSSATRLYVWVLAKGNPDVALRQNLQLYLQEHHPPNYPAPFWVWTWVFHCTHV